MTFAMCQGRNYLQPTLSRVPIAEPGPKSVAFQNELELLIETVTLSLSTSHNRLQEYCDEQKADPVCSRIRNYCTSGWPDISQIPSDLKLYAEICHELTLCNDILLRDCHIVVPTSLQKLTLDTIHHDHQGIQNVDQEPILQFGGHKCHSKLQKRINPVQNAHSTLL